MIIWDLISYKTYPDLRAEASKTYINYLWWVIDPVLGMLVSYLVFGLLFQPLSRLRSWVFFSIGTRGRRGIPISGRLEEEGNLRHDELRLSASQHDFQDANQPMADFPAGGSYN